MILLLAALLPTLASAPADTNGATELPVPLVEYKADEASATAAPWITANGWRFTRDPSGRYFYSVPADAVALAAAEAFAYGANALIKTDAEGAKRFEVILGFLKALPPVDLPGIADVGVIDDGSDETGELLNLLSRRNLLYKVVKAPDEKIPINVLIGSKEFPKEEADDPHKLAASIRYKLTDDRRTARLYGSEVVIMRLQGDGNHVRIHLLNYSKRPVEGVRVRVLGTFKSAKAYDFEDPNEKVEDFAPADDATELTLPIVNIYAVIDLSR